VQDQARIPSATPQNDRVLKCRVSYAETVDGKLRAPSWRGLIRR